MDGTTLIKVEENIFNGTCSGDSDASASPQTSLQQPDGVPLRFETITGRVAKIKREHSLEEKPVLNHKKTTIPPHFLKSEDTIEYRCELCLADGKKLILYANKNALKVHTDKVHRLTPKFKCQICFKPFNCVSNFKRHTRAHLNQTKSFKCEVCSRAFTSKAGLNIHLVSKHKYSSEKLKVKVFPCDLCSHVSFGKSTLEKHVVRVHVVDKALECHVCSKTFIDQDALSKHLKDHDDPSRHVCDVCSKAYANRTTLLHHLKVEHKKFFYCNKRCKKSFSNKSDFDAHSELLSQNEFPCQICSQPFRSQCSLSLHIEFHNLKEPRNQDSDLKGKKTKNNSDEFKCEICLKTFDREAYITAHKKLVHPILEWPCSKCPRTFKYRNQMETHELTHGEVKPHACKACDKSYYTAQELKVHENNKHTKTKHFKCQLCPKSFAASSSLKLHKAEAHGGDRPFQCHVCGTSWVTEGRLKQHLVSHRTERMFPCEICPKSFKDLKQLKTHVRVVHDNVKRASMKKPKKPRIPKRPLLERESLVFICNLCSFETQEDKEVAAHYNSHGLPKITLLRRPLSLVSVKHNSRETKHLKRNINVVRSIEKRYKCSTCSKLLISPGSLQSHLYLHLNRNPKACSKCSSSFRSSSNLTRHLLTVHKQGKKVSKRR